MRVGIFFGGRSREREISFAGGRTVYDLLNKSIFTPVPIFIDSLGNFIELDWQFLYKGSIRDFYPPNLSDTFSKYSVYIESLQLSKEELEQIILKVGKQIQPAEFSSKFDFVFLALHGPYGEDGSIQGLLEYYNIPYSGSGILPSSIGINKVIQKELMNHMQILAANSISISREEWTKNIEQKKVFFENAKANFDLPVVIKSGTQGSSIGVNLLKEWEFEGFCKKIDNSFFMRKITAEEWRSLDENEKHHFINTLSDIYEGYGIPFLTNQEVIYHPDALEQFVESHFNSEDSALTLESVNTEPLVLIEEFIEGKEFSCIVIEDEDGKPLALPPTEIIKSSSIFDYRAKYLPGISRKITPIELPENKINEIIDKCKELFSKLQFDVYARIDGLIKKDGSIYLNDPNTTSGMLPSSFFFHQAAEIGLSPSQFLTFIIFKSMESRLRNSPQAFHIKSKLRALKDSLEDLKENNENKLKVGVLLGGVSSERHISVESGRNVFEKLSSSGNYNAVPLFLTEHEGKIKIFRLPMNLLLKDNADDIREKTIHYKLSPVVIDIIKKSSAITKLYATSDYKFEPEEISMDEIKKDFDFIFIALHGRPGEDGTLQKEFEHLHIPYNGSGAESSAITINKYITNEILHKNGLLTPKHKLITINEWNEDRNKVLEEIELAFTYPLIAKPADDGCSSAVKKIAGREELASFIEAIFRNNEELPERLSTALGLKMNEVFPKKDFFLVEELVQAMGAKYFLEITGGMLTSINEEGEIVYEVFEPSEALAEKGILSLEEKFLAGEGQNITPARFPTAEHGNISKKVRDSLLKAAKILNIEGYCRIDAFVRIYDDFEVEIIFIEVNSLPGLTPATCIFHQAAINGYKPTDFLDNIIKFGIEKEKRSGKK